LRKLPITLFVLALVFLGPGCGRRAAVKAPPRVSQPPPPRPTYKPPRQTTLVSAARSGHKSPLEVAKLSDRLLAEGSSTFRNEQTMAQLDILITKSIKGTPRDVRHRLLRNLGILHYHQKKFKLARQEIQQANEIFPRDARTHFYLARLAVHQGKIYQRQGLTKKAKGQFKLAAYEMELARKFEPSNPLFRQDLKQILRQERSFTVERQK